MRHTLPSTIAFYLCLLGPVLVHAQGAQPIVHNLGNGVVAPKAVKSVTPTYTPQARAARVQGTVTIDAVVLSDGKVGDVSVTRSELWRYRGKSSKDSGTVVLLTPSEVAALGLDKQALDAAKRWVFQPGTKDRKPVAVRIQIGLKFVLGAA